MGRHQSHHSETSLRPFERLRYIRGQSRHDVGLLERSLCSLKACTCDESGNPGTRPRIEIYSSQGIRVSSRFAGESRLTAGECGFISPGIHGPEYQIHGPQFQGYGFKVIHSKAMHVHSLDWIWILGYRNLGYKGRESRIRPMDLVWSSGWTPPVPSGTVCRSWGVGAACDHPCRAPGGGGAPLAFVCCRFLSWASGGTYRLCLSPSPGGTLPTTPGPSVPTQQVKGAGCCVRHVWPSWPGTLWLGFALLLRGKS